MSRTVEELAQNLNSIGKHITSARNDALNAMGAHAKNVILDSARQVVPDLRLSGVGKGGARINVRYTRAIEHVLVKATGPWQFIEYDTKPHVITSKGLRGTRKSRAAAVTAGTPLRRRTKASPTRLNINGSFRAYVKHPGTKGQHPFRDGAKRAQPELPQVAAKVYRQAITRALR